MVYSEESVRQAVQRILGRCDSAARAAECRRAGGSGYQVTLDLAGRRAAVTLSADLVADYLDSEEQLGGPEWTRAIRRALAELEGRPGAEGAVSASPQALKAAAAGMLMGMTLEAAAKSQGIPVESLREYLREQRR
ncbi:MAG TPA: hypothetical protein VGN26_20050 [Armatimonadota bacterium]